MRHMKRKKKIEIPTFVTVFDFCFMHVQHEKCEINTVDCIEQSLQTSKQKQFDFRLVQYR